MLAVYENVLLTNNVQVYANYVRELRRAEMAEASLNSMRRAKAAQRHKLAMVLSGVANLRADHADLHANMTLLKVRCPVTSYGSV